MKLLHFYAWYIKFQINKRFSIKFQKSPKTSAKSDVNVYSKDYKNRVVKFFKNRSIEKSILLFLKTT